MLWQPKDRIGFKNRRLLVVECLEKPSDRRYGGTWKCVCDCGNTKIVRGGRIPRSCGCSTGEFIAKGVKTRGRKPQEASMNLQYCGHKSNAQRCGTDPLDRETWEQIVKQPCLYCGQIDARHMQPSRFKGGRYTKLTASEIEEYTVHVNGVDRVDSNKPYVADNCVPCCRQCNLMKNGYTEEEFLQAVKRIYEKHNLSALEPKPGRYVVHMSHPRGQARFVE